MILSFSRERNSFEKDERNTLLLTGKQKRFDDSLIAKNLAQAFIRGIHQILDFSSLNKDTLIYRMLIDERPINTCLLSIISLLRKNSPLYFKEELGGTDLQAFWGLSPKQYSLVTYDNSLKIPSLLNTQTNTVYKPHETCTLACDIGLLTPSRHTPIMRVKGVKRSIQQKILTPQHFQKTAERFCHPKRILQHSLIRRDRRMFLVSQSRQSFTRFCNKAYFTSRFSNKDHHFSFPLFMKELVEC